MPVYEYGCKECENIFTEWAKVDDRMVPCWYPCPECNREDCVELLISSTSFVLKGGGWYKDGY